MPPATGTAGTRAVPARPPAAAWPLRPGVVIAIAAVLGLGLRAFALARPGYLIATTDGQDLYGPPSVSARDTEAWQAAFEHAQYVWLYGNRGYTGARIIWTSSLHAYFVHHFRLIGLRSSFGGSKLVPGGGLYVRT